MRYFVIILLSLLLCSCAQVKTEIHLEQALEAEKAGNTAQAIASYQEALKRDASLVKAYVNLGSIYQREGRLEEAIKMMHVYADFAENFMGVPVIKGTKSANERFAGALETFCIEALMQDGKALQAGTSHFLGQNFAKAFDVTFVDKSNKQDYVWASSWGVSTRLMGALIMTHSDDNGLVLPPKLAPFQVVIVPIYKNEEQLSATPDSSGMYYISLNKPGGRKIESGDTLEIHYEGRFLYGRFFDSTRKRDEVFTFVYGQEWQVVEGLEKAIGHMHEGEKALVILPSELAFGEYGSSGAPVYPRS